MEGDRGANRMKTPTAQLLPDEQLMALHQQMVEKEVSYHHKLQNSQEAQHRQAVLVQKLQTKVIQYRNWCQELEQQLEASRGSCPRQWDRKEDQSLEKALIQLEEEQQRCENLAGMNILLREHLDKANEVNEALREDINKLTVDWTRAKEELEHKEREWHKVREHFDKYMWAEQDRILGIWRQVVTLRRYFLEMKTATDRDFSELRAEQVKLSSTILVNCFRLNSDQQSWEARRLGSPDLKGQIQQKQFDVKPEKIDLNKDICQKAQAFSSGDLVKEDLRSRVMELTELLEQSQKQNEEKEKTMKALGDTVEILGANRLELEYEHSLIKDANEEILFLQHAIKEIIKVVIDDNNTTVGNPDAENCPDPFSLLQMNACDPEGAVILVRDVLTKRSNKVQHLKHQLLSSQKSVSSLEKQREQQEEECKFLRQRLQQLEGEQDTLTSQLQHFQSMVETLRSGHAILEKSKEELQQQLEVLEEEARHLRQSNTKLHLKGDTEVREKEDQLQEMERVLRDREYIQKRLNALEEKHSLLKNELVAKGEALKKSHLDGELVKQEKHELALALDKAEQSIAELTLAQNKLVIEAADLREVTAKMSALNESLALDKVDLNQLLLKLEQENQSLLKKVDNLEGIRMSSKKRLNQTERTNKELQSEKMQLEQLLHQAEEMQENLQEELRILRAEHKETHEELSQARHQQGTSRTTLEQAHQESSHLREVLAKVSREKELLMHEKAALAVRLEAVERERQTLTQQVTEIRLAKELLEASLFQAQQHVSELEVIRSQLEIQVQTISEAKKVIQGEVKCLSIELEAEKSKTEQEKRDKAEQLLEAEQKYQETLNHFQTVHKEEMITVFQELETERERHCIELRVVLERVAKEKEEIESVYDRKLLELQQEISAVQTQVEGDLIQAKKDKQEVLLEKDSERKSLLEELTRTKEELTSTCQQLEHLHQEMKMHEEQKQSALRSLEAELKDAQTTMEMLGGKHKEEIKSLKGEINLLLQQRDALQSQVQDLESQLSTANDSCQLIRVEAQQRLREVQELTRQKAVEVAELQKKLEAERGQREEMEHQNTELRSQKEEVEHWNAELRATLKKQWEEEQGLNKELKNKQEEAEHQHATIQRLETERSQWEEEERKNSERHAVLRRQWEEAKCQNKELQRQKREAELLNVELQHQKEELERQNAELKSVLQRQKEEAEHECAMLQSSWEEAQQRYSEVQSWKEKIERQNTELQSLLRSQQEELECKNMELQMKQKEMDNQNAAVQKMKKEQNRWEEVECQNTELKATLQALEQERASLAGSLKEKEVKLKRLQESDCAHQSEVTKLNTALQQAQQLLADHRRDAQELGNQMQLLRQTMLEKEAVLIGHKEKEAVLTAHKEKLTQDLDEARAGEQRLRDSVKMLEAEASQLRLSLSGTESRAEALASECQRTCLARWEAQSQLTKLHSVLQYMLCNDSEEKLEHGGRGDRTTGSSTSPCKEQGDVKGMAVLQLKDLSTELTVERVAEAIQDLRQDVWHARRERDEIRKNSEKLKQELTEKEVERDRISAKAQELQKWLDQSQEEKKMADGKCVSLESVLKVEVIAFKEENVTLRAKVTTLEKSLERAEKQKKDALNERETLQMAKDKMVWELDLLRESVTASEIRANAMEKMNQSLEQELQAALSALRIKQEEVETQQERLMTLQQEAKVGKDLQEKLDHLIATVAKRDEDIDSYLKQIRDLERHREVQKATVEHLTKDLEKKGQEIESQKSQFEELGKQNKLQTAALERLNLDLEDSLQTMQSQKEKIQKLEELTQSQRTVIESLTLNLEEKTKDIQIKEEKIFIIEQNESSQIGALLKDLDELKEQLSEKDWELTSQKQLHQEQGEQAEKQVKALQTSLEHMKAILKDKEREVESQKEQITSFQQCVIQREAQLHLLREKVKNVTFTLTQRDQELELQKQKIREMEEEMEVELKALHELLAKTQPTLKERDKELEFQRQHLEMVERQVKDLLGDIQCSTVALKERDDSIEKEKIKHLRKQEDELQLQETVPEMLGKLKVVLRRREQEIESLKQQYEDHNKQTDRRLREVQEGLQEAKQSLRNREREVESLKEENCQLQQREEVAKTQTKSILEKLESSKSSLQDRDQEIESLQGRVQELSRLTELKENNLVRLQQNLDRINQITKEKDEEILKQAKQINIYLLEVETTQAELQACKSQVSHLEEAIRKRECEQNFQNCQHKHEQADMHHLQVLAAEKGNEKHPREKEEIVEEDQEERVRMNGQREREQKKMNDEIKEFQENIQYQHILEKKDDEIKQEKEKVKQLEEKIRGKEEELQICSEHLKQIISALRLQDSEQDNVKNHIQNLLVLKEEEAARRKVFQEKEQKWEWQKEKIQQLEEEKRMKEEELDCLMAVLKQTESAEIEWREKAQKLGLSLSQSEEALKALRKEVGIMQTMVSERDKDRFHIQEQLNKAFRALEEERHITKALTGEVDLLPRENGVSEMWPKEAGEAVKKEGEPTWAIERRLLYRRLKLLQEAVARLENDKQGLEQHNIQLRGTLEQVERERRRLKRTCGDLSLSFSLSQADSGPSTSPAVAKEETLYKQLADLRKQVSVLQTQLSLERKQKQDYIDSCAKTSQELSGLHQELSQSLNVVAREPEATVLASETRKLDETLNHSLALTNISWGGILSGKYPISSTPKTVQQKDSR
uniref:centrosome-associated protein CEP250 n=1 Tax=Euleptes europaea TaxID=460621 RepID=UPI00253FA705|nr:centrosome-associated protein CEP250 [Euleptes europaea]